MVTAEETAIARRLHFQARTLGPLTQLKEEEDEFLKRLHTLGERVKQWQASAAA